MASSLPNDRKYSSREGDQRIGSGGDEKLGGPRPPFEDESLAPMVDWDVLTALVRRELTREQARQIYQWIYSFQSWSDAHAEVLVDEFRAKQTRTDHP